MGVQEAKKAGICRASRGHEVSRVDQRAFEILVRQHHRRLLGFALALVDDPGTAEDLVQEAFVTAYAKLATFDPAGNFGAWLRSIVRFKYLEWCRKRHETALAPEKLAAIAHRHGGWDESEQERAQTLVFLQACVKRLPEAMAQVVELFYFQDWRGRDIAAHTGESELTIRKRLERARGLLADCVRSRMQEQEGGL